MNYYELLGVSVDASEEEIKSAYKREIKKWHPDINKDEEAVSITMRLNEAKETLLNLEKRLEYDNFINHKEDVTYQKYTNTKAEYQETDFQQEEYEQYEEKLVTKWEYLKEYLHSSNINIFKRFISLIFVLLETFLCFLLKYLIILLSYLCFVISNIIILVLKIISPLLFVLIIYLVYMGISKGFSELLSSNTVELRAVLIMLGIYIVGIILPFVGRKLISQKVFDFLYNKLDVYLFKKSVGYK